MWANLFRTGISEIFFGQIFMVINQGEKKIIYLPVSAVHENFKVLEGGQATIFVDKNPKLELEVVLAGEGASLRIFGRFHGRENDSQEIKLCVLEEAPRTSCLIEFRSALADSSYSFFDGLIRMSEKTEGATGLLSYRALLLSDKAKTKPIPRLEVLSKKVARAGHEASVGKISQDQLFYLQSRGLSCQAAQDLIVDGFMKICQISPLQ